MRKFILAVLLLCSSPAWATCTVTSIYVLDAGVYDSIATPNVFISGPGAGGSTAKAYMVPYGGGHYYVSSVVVTAPGSYTGPVTVTFTGGQAGDTATGYAVMGGSCASGGARKRFAWLL